MTSQTLPRQASLFLLGDLVEAGTRQLRKTVVISLVVHLCLLAVIMGMKLFKKVERPLSAMQVSLVTLPTSEAKDEPKVEKAVPRPTPQPKPVQSTPIPVPPSRCRRRLRRPRPLRVRLPCRPNRLPRLRSRFRSLRRLR